MASADKTVVIERGVTRAQLVRPPERARSVVKKALSYRKKGYEHSPSFKAGLWDGTISMLSGTGSFPSGLVPRVISVLESKGYDTMVTDHRVRPDVFLKPLALFGRDLEDVRSDIQEQLIDAAIAAGQGLLSAHTGLGKTEVIAGLIQRVDLPSLVLTHKRDLLKQTAERLAHRLQIPEREIGRYGDGAQRTGKITVATFQTVHGRLDGPKRLKKKIAAYRAKHPKAQAARDYDLNTLTTQLKKAMVVAEETRNWLAGFPVVIGDEVHHAQAPTFYAVVNSTPAYFRWGVSATVFKSASPTEKADPETELKLVGAFGEVVATFGIDEGVKHKTAVRARIRMPNWAGGTPKWSWDSWQFPFDDDSLTYADLYTAAICGLPLVGERGKAYGQGATELGKARNASLVRYTQKLVKAGRPTLILLSRIEHGELLSRKLTRAFDQDVPFLSGRDDTGRRAKALSDMKNGNLLVMIATTIFDEGVDAPSIGGLVLAGAGKAVHLSVQRLGRGQRLETGKHRLWAYDPYDTHTKVLWKQARQRYLGYQKINAGSIKIVRGL